MNDLISRQAAIDAFDKQYWNLLDIPICKEIRDAAKRTIKALPAVQPQLEEDCDTCKHGYFGDRQCDNCRVRFPSHYEREEEHHEG